MDTEIAKDDWIFDAKKALNWFVEMMGPLEWNRRRTNVIDYFNRVEFALAFPNKSVHNADLPKDFKPLAVYDDWLGWYMYLIESLVDRPSCDEPAQSARIYPVFAAIGRRLDELKAMIGVRERVLALLNEKQNQPDSTLFELVVALCYSRNGWQVEFLKESKLAKMPDLVVSRGPLKYYVECKRLSKVNKYAESERQDWQRRFRHLAMLMQKNGIPVFAKVIFKVPVANTGEQILADLFTKFIQKNAFGEIISTPDVDFSIEEIDIAKINSILSQNYARQHSPQLISIITGDYDCHGNYALIVDSSEIAEFGLDDGLHILNKYIGGLHTAYAAKWDCIAGEAVERKAADINWALLKAVSQIPDGHRGIIHIGYETVTGPIVEKLRYEKIVKTILNHDYSSKKIDFIYCHAIQPLAMLDRWECAETTSHFGFGAQFLLPELLLLDIPGTETRATTHWDEDILDRQ